MLPRHEEKLSMIREMLQRLGTDLINGMDAIYCGLNTQQIGHFEEAKHHLKNSVKNAREIDNEIVTSLALFGAEASDLRSLVAYLRVTNEFVRIAENIKTVSKRITPLINSELFAKDLQDYSIHLCKSASNALESSIGEFIANDASELELIYQKVLVEESKADDLYAIFEKNVLLKLSTIKEFDSKYIEILGTMRKFERISDRAVNVAKLLMFAKIGGEMNAY